MGFRVRLGLGSLLSIAPRASGGSGVDESEDLGAFLRVRLGLGSIASSVADATFWGSVAAIAGRSVAAIAGAGAAISGSVTCWVGTKANIERGLAATASTIPKTK